MGHLRIQARGLSCNVEVSSLQKNEVQVAAAPDINGLPFRVLFVSCR